MLTIIFKYKLSLIIYLRYFHKTLSGSSVNESLYFMIMLLNSSFEKDINSNIDFKGILSKTS